MNFFKGLKRAFGLSDDDNDDYLDGNSGQSFVNPFRKEEQKNDEEKEPHYRPVEIPTHDDTSHDDEPAVPQAVLDTLIDIVNGNLSPSDEEDYLKAIGLTTARLHNAGMIHHDYSRGNLLLGKNAEGKACVELIDLNRLRFHEISMDEGCQNFAERLPATDVQRHTMAEAYAKERGFDVERCYELMMKYNKEKT